LRQNEIAAGLSLALIDGMRRILGVLSLAKKYGAAAVDEACAAALEIGVQEYRFVRRYLERRPQAPLSLQQVGKSIL